MYYKIIFLPIQLVLHLVSPALKITINITTCFTTDTISKFNRYNIFSVSRTLVEYMNSFSTDVYPFQH